MIGPVNHAAITRFVTRLVGHQDAEDVASDTVVKVLERHRSFKAESRWETWVFAIAKRTALSHLRQRNRRGPHLELRETDGVVPPLDEVGGLADPRLRLVSREIHELVQAWHTYGTRAEAAAALGLTLSQFKDKLSKARQAVRA